MSDLYLVRHAQASFNKEDYDQLSELGYEQSRLLAQRVFQRLKPDSYFSGSLKRHHQTLAPLLALHQEQLSVEVLSGFNEFDYFDVLQQYRKEWRTKADMMKTMRLSENPMKAFEENFRQSIARWISTEYDSEYKETWAGFKSRVVNELNRILTTAQNASKILVLTSGGPISVICQHLLGLSDHRTFEINATLANTGITRIKFSQTRCSIAGLNDIAHLEHQPTHLITYR